MTPRSRMAKLRKILAALPVPDEIHLMEWIPVGSKGADGRPPGAYQRQGSNVAAVVFEGDEPDPALLARIKPRISPHVITIIHGPDFIPPPASLPE